jgi:hypothetical protein
MLQLQFEPGSMPAASTAATNVATGGSTATGCAAATTVTGAGTGAGATTVTGAGTGAGATVVDDVVGVDVVEIAVKGTDVGVVVVGPSAAPVVAAGVVRVGIGLEEGTDGVRWGLSAMTVVRVRAEATPATTSRTGSLPRRDAPLILRLMPSTRPVSVARRGAGAAGTPSTMC